MSRAPIPLSRRRLLTWSGGALAAGALTGCGFFDPTVHGAAGTPGVPEPDPTPAADQLAVIPGLQALSRTLASVVNAKGSTAAQQAWARACQSALGLHELVLRRPDPLDGRLSEPPLVPPTTAPAPTPVAQALADLRQVAAASSSELLAMATKADPGAAALLWGSLAVFAGLCATPTDHPPVDHKLLPHHFEASTLVRAQGVLVEQFHRAEQATSAVIGALDQGDLRTSLRTRLTELASQRVEVENAMRESGATPPPPEAGYALPQRPTAANAAAVMGAVETDLANARAGVFSSTGADGTGTEGRDTAFAAWSAQSSQAARWTPVAWFPGWV